MTGGRAVRSSGLGTNAVAPRRMLEKEGPEDRASGEPVVAVTLARSIRTSARPPTSPAPAPTLRWDLAHRVQGEPGYGVLPYHFLQALIC